MKSPHKRKRTLLAFLPAIVVIGVVAATAAGISIVSSASATTVTVTGTVDATLNIPASATDPSNTGAGGTCTASGGNASFSILAGWESGTRVTGGCTINFGSTNGAIQLSMQSGNPEPQFYCLHQPSQSRDCSGNGSVNNVAPGAAIGVNNFGIALESTPINAVAGATVAEDADNNALAADASWYPIDPSTPAELCQTSAPGTGSCVFKLGVRGRGTAPSQTAGHYDGSLVLTAAQL